MIGQASVVACLFALAALLISPTASGQAGCQGGIDGGRVENGRFVLQPGQQVKGFAFCDGPPGRFEVTDPPDHGPFAVTRNEHSVLEFNYTPDVSYRGPDSATFRSGDGRTVHIPMQVVDPALSCVASIGQPHGTVRPGVETSGEISCDANSQAPPSFTIVEKPTRGTLSPLKPNPASGASRTFTYTTRHPHEYRGSDEFVIRVARGDREQFVPVRFTIAGPQPNRAPECGYDSRAGRRAQAGRRKLLILYCGDRDGDPFTGSVLDRPDHGRLGPLRRVFDSDDRVYYFEARYTPNAAYRGPDSFTVRVTDGRTHADFVSRLKVIAPVNPYSYCKGRKVRTRRKLIRCRLDALVIVKCGYDRRYGKCAERVLALARCRALAKDKRRCIRTVHEKLG